MRRKGFFKRKVVPRSTLRIGKIPLEFRAGIHRSIMSGHGIEFKGLAPFEGSGDFSKIDWVASSRLSDDDSEMVVREFNPEREISIICAIDDTHSMGFPNTKQEIVSFLVSFFASSALKYGDYFQVVFFTDTCVSVSERIVHEDDLRAVSLVVHEQPLVRYLNEEKIRNTLLVIISDCGKNSPFDIDRFHTLGVHTKNIRILMCCLDEWKDAPSHSFEMTVKDPETGDSRILSFRKGADVHTQVRAHEWQFEELSHRCRSLGALCVQIGLLDNPLKELRRSLIRSGIEV